MSRVFIIISVILLCLISVAGDCVLKIASEQNKPIFNRYFLLGYLLYSSTVFFWVWLFKYINLANLGVIYCATTLILLTLSGVLLFHERLTPTEMMGVVFAGASIFFLSRLA